MKHWTENDFEQWLYGLKEPDSHTEACHDCRAEFGRLALTRRRVVASPEVAEEFLAAQRRAIHSRLQHAARNFARLRWAVSIAVLLAVAIGLTLPHSKNASVTLTNDLTNDDQLYSDLARIEQTDEPKAIQPLHNLFEE